MLKIMMKRTNLNGYEIAGYVETIEEAHKRISELKNTINPTDIYFTTC